MPVTARSTPNIALIKYWGNRNEELRLPMADSVSMTLDSPSVEVSVEQSDSFSLESFESDGSKKTLKPKDIERIQKHLDLTRTYLKTLGPDSALSANLAITIRSHIPPAIGLASSAAVFSCLATAYAGLAGSIIAFTPQQVSVIARLGSGSAARSIYGGYGALLAGSDDSIGSSFAVQIADETHWKLHDFVLIPTHEEKKVGSTEGHALAGTSPLFAKRIAEMLRRNGECIDAIRSKDFEKLQQVTEEDCWDMHNVMQTSTPALNYLNDTTYRLTDEITELRESKHLPILYTMDAGPTVHVICPVEVQHTCRKSKISCTVVV
jgi:diphosphomevalonate decarboxylase